MPKKKLQRSLQDYLSKIKNRPTPHIRNPKSFILSGCKHPKTGSFAANRTRSDDGAKKDDEAALEDIDRFLFDNFRSLYLRDEDITSCNNNVKDEKGKGPNMTAAHTESFTGAILFDSPRLLKPRRGPGRLDRFFVGPESSSSRVEETRSSTASTVTVTTNTTTIASSSTKSGAGFTGSVINNDSVSSQKEVRLPDDSIAVLAHSPSPYDGFMLSIREMVKARMTNHGQVDWGFMEELLFCYLNLNEKRYHKYILNALVDLIVELRQSSGRSPVRHREACRVARVSRKRNTGRHI